MTKNTLGREIPTEIEGYGKTLPYAGAFARKPEGHAAGARLRSTNNDRADKRVAD